MVGVHAGHCGKLEAILQLFEHAHKDRDWLVIADDDTLLRWASGEGLLSPG